MHDNACPRLGKSTGNACTDTLAGTGNDDCLTGKIEKTINTWDHDSVYLTNLPVIKKQELDSSNKSN
jgi:hypothetical protein